MTTWKRTDDGRWARTTNGVEEVVSVNPNITDGARKLAEEKGIDVTQVEGSGKEGTVTVEDVKTHAPA